LVGQRVEWVVSVGYCPAQTVGNRRSIVERVVDLQDKMARWIVLLVSPPLGVVLRMNDRYVSGIRDQPQAVPGIVGLGPGML
jgi:hypothetical protein